MTVLAPMEQRQSLQLFLLGGSAGLTRSLIAISRGLGGLPKPRSNKMRIAARRTASLLVFSMILTSSATAAGACCRACAGKEGLSPFKLLLRSSRRVSESLFHVSLQSKHKAELEAFLGPHDRICSSHHQKWRSDFLTQLLRSLPLSSLSSDALRSIPAISEFRDR